MPLAADLGVESVQFVVEEVYGIEGSARGDEYDITCPDPTHIDSKPSTSVNLVTGLWKCLGCGCRGDLIGLGVLALQENRHHVERLLAPRTHEAVLGKIQRRITAIRFKPNKPANLILPGPYEPGPLTEMYERGLTPETCRKWGVRYVHSATLEGKKKTFTITASVAIPVRDRYGYLLAWCYRRTEASQSWQPRYLYTPEAELSEMWFGPHHHADANEIVVVEGALDAMWLDQAGIPALALLGSSMGTKKIKYLERYAKVTIMGDRDRAGILMVKRIGETIGNKVPVRVARYDKNLEGRDPGELAPVDVELAIARAVPWTLWSLNRRTRPKTS